MKPRNGHTLIELLIVLAIISIVIRMSWPSMITWRRNAVFRTTVEKLRSDIKYARSKAVTSNGNAAIIFNEGYYFIYMDNGKDALNWRHDKDEDMLRNVNLPPATWIDLKKTTFRKERFRFNPRGIPVSPGRVAVCAPHWQYNIVINRMGRIRTEIVKRP